MRTPLRALALALALSMGLLAAPPAWAARDVVREDHYVSVTSTAPAVLGQEVKLYVRELKPAGPPRGVVLFVHGAGTPSEVAFDLEHGDYSWMAYLARAGFDVFAVDLTGYGRSTRPAAMADPCNLASTRQADFVPAQIPAPCPPTWGGPLSTIASDWSDMDAVVDRIVTLRGFPQVALVGWSQGGPRTMGYAAAHPEKVSRLVVLAPAYRRDGPLAAPDPLPARDGSVMVQSEKDFIAGWDRQVGCPGQYDPAVAKAVWKAQLASDPYGATWTPPVRRAPAVPSWGVNKDVVASLRVPYLMIAGALDKAVVPSIVQALYEDLGSPEKVLVDLACSSHNAAWEKNHLLLFKASLDWLTEGKVEGISHGVVKLGY